MLTRQSVLVRLGLGFVAMGATLGGGLAACGSGDDSSTQVPDAAGPDAKADSTTDATTDTTVDSPSDASDAADSDASGDADAGDAGVLSKINHFVVIYMENHSFDNLYGEFPGADGLNSLPDAGDAGIVPRVTQQAPDGAVYDQLPFTAADITINPSLADAALPNAPFSLESFAQPNQLISDLPHIFFTEQFQINDGGMNQFVFFSTAAGLTMGHWHTMELPVPNVASQYTVCDNFFHAAFGGSFLNHFWLIAARTPEWPNPPSPDAGGPSIDDPAVVFDNAPVGRENQITSDGFVVNTSFSVNTPHPSNVAAPMLVPNQTFDTIGDLLSEANQSWAWYAGGWNDAIAAASDAAPPGFTAENFQYHHQPFVYFANFADGTAAKAQHLKDETDFMSAAAAGQLPAVSFVKPVGKNNEHPGYTDVLTGESHLMALITAVQASPNWGDTAIIITYDEHGGQWDHVAPPKVDRWGPGSRVPTIIISPHAKKGVDKTLYDTTSILKTIEKRFGLRSLTTRDQTANDLSNAFH
jgi:phospholipase C